MPVTRAYLGLGANLDSPEHHLLNAFDDIAATPGITLCARSSLYRSAPMGYTAQPDFINAVAAIDTALAPADLLPALRAIEGKHGRVRNIANGPRTLDIDILIYGSLQSDDENLTLPHPRAHLRAFVLAPLLEIDPGCIIPGRGPASGWLARCRDQVIVRIAAAAVG